MNAMSEDRIDVAAFQRFERDGWDRAAHLYDAAWGTLTLQFVAPLLDAAGIAPGQRVLDLACGPGYVAAAAAARGAEVMGVDLSPAMVREARRLHPGIDFREGSAERLELPDASFDRVLLSFGVLHLADPEAAFREARRVLRMDGRLGFTIWAPPEESPGARLVDAAVDAHAEPVEDLPAGPPAFRYADRDLCRQALAEAGFDPGTVRFSTVQVSWRVPSPEFVFEAELRAGVRTAALLARQSPERLAAIRRDLEAGIAEFADGDGYAVPMAAHVVVAGI
jgi:SAM-dependent methyltransferase